MATALEEKKMAHELPPLPYDYTALEPTIDEKTMHLHHDMHHAAYVKNLNAALEKYPNLQSKSAEDLIRDLNAIPEDIRGAVRNNGGGHVNHTMFWKIMKPKGGGDPSGAIAEVIKKTFGDFKISRTKFNEAGVKQFGSGWVWLAGNARRRSANHQHAQSGQPNLARLVPHFRQRRLGARLLPEIQQSPPRISGGLVERSELG
jgi:superoxide dismutase